MAVLLVAALAAASLPAAAQRYFNNPISQYYRDGYLWNPALAGNEGTRIYGLLNKSWIGFEGAPRQINIAGDMKIGESSGAGIQLISDKSGVFQRYMGAVSYAYVARLSEVNRLRIGGDLSFYQERLDNSALTSEGQVDLSGKSFNDKGMEFNGDLGAVFEGSRLSLGVTAYNLRSYLEKAGERSADIAIGQALASYKFKCGDDEKITLQPMMAYKIYYKHSDILTAAMQLEYEEVFHVGVYWQNTGNAMGGLGLMLKDMGEINFFYSGKNKQGYNQQYEVGLKLKIKKAG